MLSDYIALDIETSALEPSEDGGRIIWISALKILNGKIASHYFKYVNSGIQLTEDVEELIDVKESELEAGDYPEIIYPQFISFAKGLTIVCHNADFVKKFLEFELKFFNLDHMLTYICTLKLARHYFPNQKNHASDLARRLDVNTQNIDHNHINDDVVETYKIYEVMKYLDSKSD
jgi:DNA polymerase III alpha subunit (gram-positive type)